MINCYIKQRFELYRLVVSPMFIPGATLAVSGNLANPALSINYHRNQIAKPGVNIAAKYFKI